MIAPFVLAVDFMNFTYRTNPCVKNVPVPVVMRRGSFAYYDRQMGQGFDLFVRRVVTGRLGDGARAAVVVMTCDYPIGGEARAYVFDDRGTSAVPLAEVATASWGGDWGAGPDSIKLTFAKRALYVSQCGDLHCRSRRNTTYRMRGARLVKIFDQTREIENATMRANTRATVALNRTTGGR